MKPHFAYFVILSTLLIDNHSERKSVSDKTYSMNAMTALTGNGQEENTAVKHAYVWVVK